MHTIEKFITLLWQVDNVLIEAGSPIQARFYGNNEQCIRLTTTHLAHYVFTYFLHFLMTVVCRVKLLCRFDVICR